MFDNRSICDTFSLPSILEKEAYAMADENDLPPLKNFGRSRCSTEFIAVFCDFSADRSTCDACGRVHFTNRDLQSYEEGELAGLLAAEQADPERYVSHQRANDPILITELLPGQTVVIDCPCGFAGEIESFLRAEAKKIHQYQSQINMIGKMAASVIRSASQPYKS